MRLLLVSFGAAASSVCAQEGFENANQNHNNKINREEFLERETDVFFLINSDQDGHLSIMEIKNVDVARFHAADVNGDGVLSMEEFLKRAILISTPPTRTRMVDSPGKRSRVSIKPDEGSAALAHLSPEQVMRAVFPLNRLVVICMDHAGSAP